MFLTVNRWKGENVSTTEVGDVFMLADCIKEVNVYGVEVPGNCLFILSLMQSEPIMLFN